MPNKTNVVVFFSDQQRWDTTGLSGCPLNITPNFDAWASRGAYFPYATTPQPVCGPARACLQTGRFATEIGEGCHTNNRPLPVDQPTFAKQFRQAGYRTGYFGKWHLADNAGEHPDGPNQGIKPEQHGGWEDYLSANALEACSDGYSTRLYDPQGKQHDLPGYRVDAVTDAAIRFIHDAVQNTSEQGFCCMISHLEPHMQNHRDAHPAPFDYERRYRGQWTPPDLAALHGVDPFYANNIGGNAQQALPGYLGSIKRLDEALGRLMDALISLDCLENTVVVYASDHGCHFRTRNNEYKRSGHDVSLRVPVMMHGGPFIGHGRDERPFQLTDLAPTLCDAAGLEPPANAQGCSALGDLQEEAFSQITESKFGRAVRTNRWKYIAENAEVLSGEKYTDELYEAEVYDLVADPYELVNLAGLPPYAEVREEMKQRLIKRMKAIGEPEVTIHDAPQPELLPGQIGQRRVHERDKREPLTN